MKVSRNWNDSLYDVVLSYLLLDFDDYQDYLTSKSTITITLSECLAKHYLTVFSQTSLDSPHPLSSLTHQVLEALSEDCGDYTNFLLFIRFLNRIYTYHFNGAFLRSLSRAIFAIVLTPLFQNQILQSANPVVSRTAMQFLTLILENITSQKFAQCIFYFLFGLGDIFGTELPNPRPTMGKGSGFDLPVVRARARSEIVGSSKENFSLSIINNDVNASLEEFCLEEHNYYIDNAMDQEHRFYLSVNYNEFFKRKHRPSELANYIFSTLRSSSGSLVGWQLISRLMKFHLPSLVKYLITDQLKNYLHGEVVFSAWVGCVKIEESFSSAGVDYVFQVFLCVQRKLRSFLWKSICYCIQFSSTNHSPYAFVVRREVRSIERLYPMHARSKKATHTAEESLFKTSKSKPAAKNSTSGILKALTCATH
eukprot:TRINITY_DN2996_c0_g2_i1.p1 TRINITY_DN2996_c0_g2~~TRINITY_DN2996_c0_g2_i1.p1  ORF type:complete len:423 (+),score=71.11 TRINITY_DN2996_c0_g2_i1:1334-2602(+)